MNHIMSISKIFTNLYVARQNVALKLFSRYCLQCFGSEKNINRASRNCLIVKDKENVKVRSGSNLKIISNN